LFVVPEDPDYDQTGEDQIYGYAELWGADSREVSDAVPAVIRIEWFARLGIVLVTMVVVSLVWTAAFVDFPNVVMVLGLSEVAMLSAAIVVVRHMVKREMRDRCDHEADGERRERKPASEQTSPHRVDST